jgi:hypothetical protein
LVVGFCFFGLFVLLLQRYTVERVNSVSFKHWALSSMQVGVVGASHCAPLLAPVTTRENVAVSTAGMC